MIRPFLLLALVVLAPTASAATGDPVAAAAVLEAETVSTASGAQLSPQVAIDPADASRRVLVADEYPTGQAPPNGVNPRTAAWLRSGGTWSSVSVAAPTTGNDGMDNRGRPTVAWGQGNDVWVAQRVRYDPAFCSSASGVFLSRSTNRGASFGTATQLMENKSTVSPNNPALTFRNLELVFEPASARPVVVADALTFVQAGCTDPTPGASIAISAPWQPGDAAPPNPVTIVAAGHSPSVVATPGGSAQLVVAYVSSANDRVVVTRCSFQFGLLWNCLAAAQLPVVAPQSLTDGNGRAIALTPAPDLARTADGALHLVYTVQDGTNTDVVYRRSTDEGATWSAPVSVADASAEGADQFLGTIAATPGATPTSTAGRVDVAFLDRRDDGVRYRPYSQSFQVFDGDTVPSRSANRALDGAPHAAPTHNGQSAVVADVGTRLGVAAAPADGSASPSGPGLVWWPTTAASASGDVAAARLNHGTTSPSLSVGPIYTTKNVPVTVGDLLTASDDDGDPVRLTITSPPAHGSVQGSLFTPSTGYAGPDAVGVRADDGVRSADAGRLITVSNSTPVLPDATLFGVSQGSTASLQLGATDADVGDVLTYALDGDPPALLAGGVTVTPDGLLTVTVPSTARSQAIVDVRVRVTDTSPAPAGVPTGTVVARVPVKIWPVYAAVGATVSVNRNGRVVGFAAQVVDLDVERRQKQPQILWDFGDGTTSTAATPRHAYVPGKSYPWRMTLVMPRNEGQSEPVTLSGTVDVPQAGASLVTIKQRVDRRRGRLIVTLKSKLTGRVTIGLKAGGATAKPQTIALTRNVARAVPIPLAPLQGARTADLSVRFLPSPSLSGPTPTPATRKVRLR